jgi:hypothetical protein
MNAEKADKSMDVLIILAIIWTVICLAAIWHMYRLAERNRRLRYELATVKAELNRVSHQLAYAKGIVHENIMQPRGDWLEAWPDEIA